jgi:hypothetical protein
MVLSRINRIGAGNLCLCESCRSCFLRTDPGMGGSNSSINWIRIKDAEYPRRERSWLCPFRCWASEIDFATKLKRRISYLRTKFIEEFWHMLSRWKSANFSVTNDSDPINRIYQSSSFDPKRRPGRRYRRCQLRHKIEDFSMNWRNAWSENFNLYLYLACRLSAAFQCHRDRHETLYSRIVGWFEQICSDELWWWEQIRNHSSVDGFRQNDCFIII